VCKGKASTVPRRAVKKGFSQLVRERGLKQFLACFFGRRGVTRILEYLNEPPRGVSEASSH